MILCLSTMKRRFCEGLTDLCECDAAWPRDGFASTRSGSDPRSSPLLLSIAKLLPGTVANLNCHGQEKDLCLDADRTIRGLEILMRHGLVTRSEVEAGRITWWNDEISGSRVPS